MVVAQQLIGEFKFLRFLVWNAAADDDVAQLPEPTAGKQNSRSYELLAGPSRKRDSGRRGGENNIARGFIELKEFVY